MVFLFLKYGFKDNQIIVPNRFPRLRRKSPLTLAEMGTGKEMAKYARVTDPAVILA